MLSLSWIISRRSSRTARRSPMRAWSTPLPSDQSSAPISRVRSGGRRPVGLLRQDLDQNRHLEQARGRERAFGVDRRGRARAQVDRPRRRSFHARACVADAIRACSSASGIGGRRLADSRRSLGRDCDTAQGVQGGAQRREPEAGDGDDDDQQPEDQATGPTLLARWSGERRPLCVGRGRGAAGRVGTRQSSARRLERGGDNEARADAQRARIRAGC